MGEVIVFKLEKNGTHLRPPPEGSAKIFFFTGVWQEPMNESPSSPANFRLTHYHNPRPLNVTTPFKSTKPVQRLVSVHGPVHDMFGS